MDTEQLTNLIDPLATIEPWTSLSSSSSSSSASSKAVQRIQSSDKTLGISFSVPVNLIDDKTKKPSSKTTNWMVISESSEYPTAQLRAAPTAAEPDRTISIGVVIDDGFPVCCSSADEALKKRQLQASQESAMAGGNLKIIKSDLISETEALGEWEMSSGHPTFPPLLVRERIRVWNGLCVSVSVVGPKGRVSQESFDLVYDVVEKTLTIDENALRLKNGAKNNNKFSYDLERLLVISPTMNCMLNLPLSRRLLLVDGSSTRPIEHHAAPALPGTVLTRCINPINDVCLSLIALQTQDLGEEDSTNTTTKNNATISHYMRQVRSHFHAGTSIAKTVDEEFGIMTFTSPAVGVPNGKLACAARPVPPRLGSDPRLFLTIVASRVYDTRTEGAEQLIERVMMPQLVEMIGGNNNSDLIVSTIPFDIVGNPLRPDEKVAAALEIEQEDLKRPPACRYFVLQHRDLIELEEKNNRKKTNNNKSSTTTTITTIQSDTTSASSIIVDDSFTALRMGEACELQMPCFAAGDNNLSCIVSRCVWGEMSACVDGTGSNPVMRSNLMHKMQNKSIDSLFIEARYRSTEMDPGAKASTARLGSYEIMTVTPGEENRQMSSIKQGFHIGRSVGGDVSSCVCSVVVLMMNGQEQQQQQEMPPGMALSQ